MRDFAKEYEEIQAQRPKDMPDGWEPDDLREEGELCLAYHRTEINGKPVIISLGYKIPPDPKANTRMREALIRAVWYNLETERLGLQTNNSLTTALWLRPPP